MEKPKITEGEWEVVKANTSKFGVRSDKGFICFLVDPKGFEAWENYLSDAKAISAVPNLISIGLKILHKLQSETESVTAADQFELEAALKKAGCA